MLRKLSMILAMVVGIGLGALLTPDTEAQVGYRVVATSVSPAAYPLTAPDGTAGAPSYSFSTDTDTGLYLIGANDFGVVAAGSLTLRTTAAAVRAYNPFWLVNGTAAAPGLTFTNDNDTGLYSIGGTNNIGMSLGGALVMDWEDTNAAGAGADLATISSTLGAMDGAADIVNALSLNLTNADHSDGVVNALKIGTITGDAQATESLFFLGDGYDYFINDVTDTALGTLTWTTNADKDAETASGTLKVWINGTLYHIQLYADS